MRPSPARGSRSLRDTEMRSLRATISPKRASEARANRATVKLSGRKSARANLITEKLTPQTRATKRSRRSNIM